MKVQRARVSRRPRVSRPPWNVRRRSSIPMPLSFAGLFVAIALVAGSAAAEPVAFSISMRDGVRTANTETVIRDGVEYVPLGGLVTQVGGAFSVSAERAQVDLAEKSAWLRSNNPQVSASLGIFLLGTPVVQSGNDVLIALNDVPTFFEKAFRLATKQQAAVPVAAQVPGPAPLPEPEALEPVGATPLSEPPAEEVPLDPVAPPDQAAAANPAEVAAGAEVTPDRAGDQPPKAPSDRSANRPIETIVIDPGHGGSDPGCVGPSGASESPLVLAVALKLQQAIEQGSPLKTQLTRDTDRPMSRAERVNVANSKKGDLLITLHTGAAFSIEPRGFRVFVCGNEDRSTGGAYSGPSRALAAAVAKSMEEATGEASGGIYQVGCQVLKDVGMPGLMIEIGMLTNPEEERLLSMEEYQAKLAAGIAAGVKKYIATANSGSTR